MELALIGNPNVGKTALFNSLTGGHYHVGNWPGATVERREGRRRFQGQEIRIVDLPGVYGLTAYSLDQRIAREYLLSGKADAIVDIVDATNLERNLYLTLMISELERPMVVALNKWDLALRQGIRIDLEKLKERLGVPVVPTVATKGQGVEELLATVLKAGKKLRPKLPDYGPELEAAIRQRSQEIVATHPELLSRYPSRWLAIRALEGDEEVLGWLKKEPVEVKR